MKKRPIFKKNQRKKVISHFRHRDRIILKWELPSSRQCDQMARVFFQKLAISSNDNMPNSIKFLPKWAVAVAQLIELLLPTPEIHDPNPAVGKIHLRSDTQLY